jgi:diguanylate cyclase (GGDEF)-like protein/PAS domain S-box-containing protein
MNRFRERLAGHSVPSVYETVFVTKDGRAVPVELTAAQTLWQGEPAGLVLLHDITERQRAEEQMRKLSSAMEQTADSVVITDCHGVIEYVNHAFEVTTGYTVAEAVGHTPRLVKSGVHDNAFYHRLWTTILGGDVFRDVIINRHKNGNLYFEEKTITPLRDAGGGITHFISTGKDITERMQAQERLQFLAHHDALTELPNRVLFMDRLSQALNRAQWHRRVVGVMFLDLDRFKNINDTLGHDIGDRFLKAMAERLRSCVRDGDTVARLGGDEFAILLEDIAQTEDVSAVGAKILQALGVPLLVDERELFVTTSIGISLFPDDGNDAQTLLKNADAAMYRAKELGRNNCQFYSADLGAQAFERLTLETNLRHALERDEFLLSYQPEVDLKSGRVAGLEALLRWRHPEFGMVAPLQFIALAEETGMIVPIGEWVLRAALAQARSWESQGLGLPRIVINISGRQFDEPGFTDMVQRILGEIVLRSTQIEFEITESVIMQDAQITTDRLQALHELGIQFAIDDFGTGYSSLSYLRRFPIHVLKIDRSFVQDVTTHQDDAEIVKTIITMAHGLRIQVIAEGVETAEQLAFLRSHGCDMAQGYYLGRPVTPEEAGQLLRAGKRLPAG